MQRAVTRNKIINGKDDSCRGAVCCDDLEQLK
jgi:hypothetical protein